jgi:hypothetical protein
MLVEFIDFSLYFAYTAIQHGANGGTDFFVLGSLSGGRVEQYLTKGGEFMSEYEILMILVHYARFIIEIIGKFLKKTKK